MPIYLLLVKIPYKSTLMFMKKKLYYKWNDLYQSYLMLTCPTIV